MKTLIVTAPFPYAGIQKKKGERVQATNSHARILKLAGKAREATPEELGPPPAAILRSDMRANDKGTDGLVESKPGRRGRRGRGYLRSDMRAD